MHPDGYKLGEDGDVVALETDAKDKTERKAAVAVLNGNWNIVTKVDKPAKKKRGSYKRKDMKAEQPEVSAEE
tara:strand:- start:461 stop:676 length:216 start_codon:yes stop_codon:yes gene_type:complete